ERRNVADALDMDAVEIDSAAESDAAQNSQLVRGVDAVDVEPGIGLGIAELLCLGEDVGEVATAIAHRREDIVAGAVEDAVNAPEAVGRQTLAQCLDDRDAARDRGLEGKAH